MTVEIELRRLQKEAGELLAIHDRGRDLSDFARFSDDPVGFAEGPLGMGLFWDGQRKILEGIPSLPT